MRSASKLTCFGLNCGDIFYRVDLTNAVVFRYHRLVHMDMSLSHIPANVFVWPCLQSFFERLESHF